MWVILCASSLLTEIRCSLSVLVVVTMGGTGFAVRLVDVLPHAIREVRVEPDVFSPSEEYMRQMLEMVTLQDVSGLRRLRVVTAEENWGVEEQLQAVCSAACANCRWFSE